MNKSVACKQLHRPANFKARGGQHEQGQLQDICLYGCAKNMYQNTASKLACLETGTEETYQPLKDALAAAHSAAWKARATAMRTPLRSINPTTFTRTAAAAQIIASTENAGSTCQHRPDDACRASSCHSTGSAQGRGACDCTRVNLLPAVENNPSLAGWWIIFLLGQNATSKLDLLDRLGDADVPAPSGAWGDNGGASAVGGVLALS